MESTGPIRKFLFLGLGLMRRCPPQYQPSLPLVEPDGARTSRRNIIALAGMLVFAGIVSANPGDLNVFGVKPGKGVLGAMAIAAVAVAMQLYWYYLRYCHLNEDGKVENNPNTNDSTLVSINVVKRVCLRHNAANFVSNWVAFLLTVVSWIFIARWIVEALSGRHS